MNTGLKIAHRIPATKATRKLSAPQTVARALFPTLTYTLTDPHMCTSQIEKFVSSDELTGSHKHDSSVAKLRRPHNRQCESPHPLLLSVAPTSRCGCWQVTKVRAARARCHHTNHAPTQYTQCAGFTALTRAACTPARALTTRYRPWVPRVQVRGTRARVVAVDALTAGLAQTVSGVALPPRPLNLGAELAGKVRGWSGSCPRHATHETLPRAGSVRQFRANANY